MNERIKELAEQASDYYWSLDDTVRTTGTFTANPEFMEKFAELIVNECIAKAKQGQLTNMNGNQIAFVIKEHFRS